MKWEVLIRKYSNYEIVMDMSVKFFFSFLNDSVVFVKASNLKQKVNIEVSIGTV